MSRSVCWPRKRGLNSFCSTCSSVRYWLQGFPFLVGLLTLRLTGVYFTMLTLAFAQLVWGLTFKMYHFTGGDDGIQAIPKPEMLAGSVPWKYYLFSFIVVTICIYIIWRITPLPFWRRAEGIRQNPRELLSSA